MPAEVVRLPHGRALRADRRPHVEARLFDAVSRLCGPGGVSFADLSIGRLVEEAGIARATFYLYFPDRTAFALRLSEHAGELFAPVLVALWEAAGGDRATLDAAMLDMVMTFRDEQGLMSALVEAAAVDAAVQARSDERMGVLIDNTSRSLRDAQRAGRVRPDLPIDETAAALAYMLERGLYRLCRDTDPTAARRFAESFSAICWHALRPDGPT